MIFVKLQPYRQMSMKGHSYHKLNPKFFGPFRIMKKVGHVAYQLDPLHNAKIYHTIHVSQLKKHVGTTVAVPHLPVTLSTCGYIVLEPEAILEERVISKHGRLVTQALVKWFNCSTKDSNWIDLHVLQQQFSQFSP
ncbi:hypothetical protein A4A49_52152 [Nicotiana attenuata]|uniref:Tf2-1-like SH3-like domain-containing protein n=1 Tax=Nicotiana attenuata TaxID=49451 RepID=A0A314KHM5_NICAT|nr:hypothetical protein A4A49_52152 [Nicotiana attenuata]